MYNEWLSSCCTTSKLVPWPVKHAEIRAEIEMADPGHTFT